MGKGVWKGEVKVSASGQPTKLRQRGASARASRLRACTQTGGFGGKLVRNANSQALLTPDLLNQGLQGCSLGGCLLTSF